MRFQQSSISSNLSFMYVLTFSRQNRGSVTIALFLLRVIQKGLNRGQDFETWQKKILNRLKSITINFYFRQLTTNDESFG